MKKRRCLLGCARKGMSLFATNKVLEAECLEAIDDTEWSIWTNYYVDIMRKNPYYEYELVTNNRSLSWFANELKRHQNKTTIS